MSSGEVQKSPTVLGLSFLLPDIRCTLLNKRHQDGALKACLLRHLVSPSKCEQPFTHDRATFKTVFSTLQDLDFDVSLYPLFIN